MTHAEDSINLLQMSPKAGCGCKLPLEKMQEFMGGVDQVLAGLNASSGVRLDGTARDDAALYEISPEVLLVATVDIGTPVSPDLSKWGRIATQNALSDVYAMGARPVLALSILALPSSMHSSAMSAITMAAATTLAEAATSLVGGHTITSEVPLFGLSVVGTASAEEVMLVRNARPGHLLVVTKPLGTGVVVAALKEGLASPEAVHAAEQVMMSSNRTAAELAVRAGVRAATDITGYGLLGHLHNMLVASGCSAEIRSDDIPVISHAKDILCDDGVVPTSAEQNYFALEEYVDWLETPLYLRFIAADPQTSGGLLLSASEDNVQQLAADCREKGQLAVVIGEVGDGRPGSIRFR